MITIKFTSMSNIKFLVQILSTERQIPWDIYAHVYFIIQYSSFSRRVRGKNLAMIDCVELGVNKQESQWLMHLSTQIQHKLLKIEKLRKLLYFSLSIEQHETTKQLFVALTTFNRWLEFHLLQFSSIFIARHTYFTCSYTKSISHKTTHAIKMKYSCFF